MTWEKPCLIEFPWNVGVKIFLVALVFEISEVNSAATGVETQEELNRWLQTHRGATTTAIPIENDPLFTRLVSQLWSVHRSNMKDNSTLYGMQIDPISMDEMMGPMDIPIQQGFIHSTARIEGIEIHGLASMALDKSDMQRREPLDDLDIDISFHFDKIFINGTYRVNTMGIWVIPGNHWSIGMTRCFLSFLCHLALMDMAQVTTPSPTDTDEEPVKNACTESDDPMVQLKELNLPLDCAALDFNFLGLADAIVEFLGLTIVRSIIAYATDAVRKNINFLLCSGEEINEKVYA